MGINYLSRDRLQYLTPLALGCYICCIVFSCESRKILSNASGIEPVDSLIEARVDSLRYVILNDTSKYDKKDLIHTAIGTQNADQYSSLFIVNSEYFYLLDIISPDKVLEFVDEFLNSSHIFSIQIISDPEATSTYGRRGKNGVVLIKTKSKSLVNYHVGGLKVKSRNKNNFDQFIKGDIRTYD
ncbi:MAG: hypothetical protein J7621_22975 [Niastella sp.]|nr:hypothetical protein [Niastella sp.]